MIGRVHHRHGNRLFGAGEHALGAMPGAHVRNLIFLRTFDHFGHGAHRISFREASLRSLLFVIAGLSFTLYVYRSLGGDRALAYLTAYLVEESLSVDNLFVFLVIFTYFRVPEKYQARVLTWGIVGAVLMRALFIFAGTALLHKFHFMMYVFGGFLIFTGARLAFAKGPLFLPATRSVSVGRARAPAQPAERWPPP